MSPTKPKVRLAVVSPFLDKRNGTERIVVEWITRLQDSFEIHVYSQRVADLDLSNIVWHRIPKLPGPHLANFARWFLVKDLPTLLQREVYCRICRFLEKQVYTKFETVLTWERNGRELSLIFDDMVWRRAAAKTQTQTQES
jgi:hypothetical protein